MFFVSPLLPSPPPCRQRLALHVVNGLGERSDIGFRESRCRCSEAADHMPMRKVHKPCVALRMLVLSCGTAAPPAVFPALARVLILCFLGHTFSLGRQPVTNQELH